MDNLNEPFDPVEPFDPFDASQSDRWTQEEINYIWNNAKTQPGLLTDTYFPDRKCPTPILGQECRTGLHQSSMTAKEYPALLLPFKDREGHLKGVHAIRFDPQSVKDKKPKRLPKGAKISNGEISGAFIGFEGDPGPIYVTEGPEDALVIRDITESTAWAACSISNIGNLPVKVTDDIIIVCDKLDDLQRNQLLNAAANLKAEGARVRIAWFPDLEGKKDVSDLHASGMDDEIRDMIADAEEYVPEPPQEASKEPNEVIPEPTDSEAFLQKLADMERLQYEQTREGAAKELKIRVTALDELVDDRRSKEPEDEEDISLVEELEPAAGPVDGAALADRLVDDLLRHVRFKSETNAHAAALWAFGTYCMDAWQIWPKVLVSSPTKRCGKTTFLEIMEAMVKQSYVAANITAAGLFRVIEVCKPTLLVDEADRFVKADPPLNGIINAGHSRRTAHVTRVEGNDGKYDVRKFSVWAAQIIAGIGKQEDTLIDRSVRINLVRRLSTERIQKRPKHYWKDMTLVRQQILRWAKDHEKQLQAMPEVDPPDVGNDRAQDNWEPLFRIAKLLGCHWPDRVLAAYVEMESDSRADEDEIGLQLLQDALLVFEQRTKPPALQASELRIFLHGLEDSQWLDMGFGQPLSLKKMGTLMRDFGIPSKPKKHEGKMARFYYRTDIEDVLRRYTPPEEAE